MRPPISQSITFTYADDLDRAAHFFAEVMELEEVRDQGACRIFRLTDSAFLGVCTLPGRPRAMAGVTITLVSEDVEGWHDFLRAKGVAFEEEPVRKDAFGITAALLISPHGYRLEIQRFDDPLT